VFHYHGRRFRAATGDGGGVPVAHYHQDADLVWGEFTGGHVRRGSLVGTCGPDGVLDFTYCMADEDGQVISGRCHSVPDRLDDGRIRLTERWERYGPHAAMGISYLEEVPTDPPYPGQRLVRAGQAPATHNVGG
jgi:hypothetical protein